ISKSDVAKELLIQPEELDELTFGLMLNALNGAYKLDSSNKEKPNLKLVK
ncbi:MAG: putative Zn peptidase, partial [Gammaproteobacteria bacterium]|nr:putative Zn peptidase [Gammaproteobacteria bacterium]